MPHVLYSRLAHEVATLSKVLGDIGDPDLITYSSRRNRQKLICYLGLAPQVVNWVVFGRKLLSTFGVVTVQ